MHIIQQFDVEIIEDKLIIIDYDYYKPCNILIHDPTNCIFKFNEFSRMDDSWLEVYFELNVKYLKNYQEGQCRKIEYKIIK
jgi:hypothetical protein